MHEFAEQIKEETKFPVKVEENKDLCCDINLSIKKPSDPKDIDAWLANFEKEGSVFEKEKGTFKTYKIKKAASR